MSIGKYVQIHAVAQNYSVQIELHTHKKVILFKYFQRHSKKSKQKTTYEKQMGFRHELLFYHQKRLICCKKMNHSDCSKVQYES